MLFSGFLQKKIIFALVNTNTMRKTVLYIILLMLVLSACTADHEAMRQRLQYVSDCNRADTVFSEAWLPTVDSLVIYFDRHGSANDRMMAHYVQGRVYHDMGEAPQALECYQRATVQADTTSSDCDLYTLTAIYGQMANLFHFQYLPTDEMHAIMCSEHFALKEGDTLAAIKAFELRERPYYLKNDTDSVLMIKERARALYLQKGQQERAARALYVPINIFLDRHQYDKAFNAMKVFEKESAWFDDNGCIKKGKELYYYDKGRYLLASGKPDSSLFYFTKVLQAGYKEAGYKGLLMFYKKKHIADSIAKYATLFAKANDDSYLDSEQAIVHQTSAMYNYHRHLLIAEIEKKKAAQERTWKNIAVIISLAIFLATLVVIRKLKEKERRKYLHLSKEYESTVTELSIIQNRVFQQERDYQKIFDEKEQECYNLINKIHASQVEKEAMSEHIANLKLRLQEVQEEVTDLRQQHDEDTKANNRKIKSLKTHSEKLAEKLNSFTSVDMESAFKKTDIFLYFNEHKQPKYSRMRIAEHYWDNLIDEFRKYFVQFYTFIFIDNILSMNQRKYCVLIRLGFAASEIDILMNTDTNRRYRLRKLISEKLFNTSEVKTLEERLKRYF